MALFFCPTVDINIMPFGKFFMKQVSKLDKELKQELDWMNTNIEAVVKNQAMIYEELKEIEREIKGRDEET